MSSKILNFFFDFFDDSVSFSSVRTTEPNSMIESVFRHLITKIFRRMIFFLAFVSGALLTLSSGNTNYKSSLTEQMATGSEDLRRPKNR
jgi:hypothetical protein